MCELNDSYLDDERVNLNVDLYRPIIAIADLGLWNGRRPGYKMIKSGNIRDCLRTDSGDYTTYYVNEDGDLCCEASHHDGTNYIRYRVVKSGVSESRLEAFQQKLINRQATEEDIRSITSRIGHHICRVYGWKIPRKK